jgi:integrase/recombinase XerC
LKSNHIDLNKLSIKVLGKGNKERIIPISAEMAPLIKEYNVEKKKAGS